jgi:hypothetical protein
VYVGVARLWIGLAMALADTEIYANTSTPVPAVGVMAALPLVGVGVGALLFAGVRHALMALPVPLLGASTSCGRSASSSCC